MMKNTMMFMLLLAIPFTLVNGCLPPPPEAVLAGTWQLTHETDQPLTDFFLTFDSSGNLVKLSFTVGDNITVESPIKSATVSVQGTAVQITTEFMAGNLTFNGTLNETNNIIQGRLTNTITVFGISIIIDNGVATLTRL
ncbi:MAG: hypothetical protein ACYTF1_25020 [Planctomycetota bacterium]|jgi:hypothetical protein